MAQRNVNYRLALTGGGDARRELTQFGQAGEQAFGRLQQASTRSNRFLLQFDSAVTQAGQALRRFGPIAAGAAAGGLVALGARALQTAAELGEMAQRANVGVESLQQLQFAAGQFGVEQDAVIDGLKELSSRLDEFATTGGGPGAEAFQRIGINAKDAARLTENNAQAFNTVIERIGALENAAARTRILEEIFGDEAGQQLGQIGEGFRDLQERARELGLVIDGELVRQADAARDRFETLTKVISAQFTSAIAQAAPSINNLLTGLLKDLPAAIAGFENLLKRIGAVENVSRRAELQQLEEQIAKEEERLRGFLELRDAVPSVVQNAFEGLGISDLGEAVRQADQRIAELELQAGLLREEMERATETSLDLGDALNGGGAGGGGGVAGAADDAADSAEDAIGTFDRLAGAVAGTTLRLERLREVAGDDVPTAGGVGFVGPTIRSAQEAADDASESVDDLGDRVIRVGDDFDRFGETATGALREVGRSIQRNIADTFDDALAGNLDSFGDFVDAIGEDLRRITSAVLAPQRQERVPTP